jgi:endonuclease/exonuclease/phosphatase (EEP) superfamily protein YafD
VGAVTAWWWWAGELLASFRPHLVVACVALALVCAALLRPLPALVLLALAVANVAPVVHATGGSPAPVVAGAPTLVLAEQNAQGGAGSAATVLQHLADHPADVLVVLDPAPDWATFLRGPAEQMGYEVAAPTSGASADRALVLARVPVEVVALPLSGDLPPASVAFDVALDEEQIRVLATHTRNPLTPGRWRLRDDQLAAIAAWSRAQDGPIVVMGDLNVAPWSPTFTRLEHESGLVSSGEGRPSQASWPWWPAWLRPIGIPIDHLLHSPDLVVAEREVQPSIGSQHGVLAVTLGPGADTSAGAERSLGTLAR